MTSLVLNAAVTTLVHDRLRLLHDALERKAKLADYAGARVPLELLTQVRRSLVERQVTELARRALEIFESGPRAPIAPGAPRTGIAGTGTSKLAILGSAATHLPSLTDVHLQHHRWIGEVLRRGSPDPSQSHVVTPAIQAAFTTVERALHAARENPPVQAIDESDARAFALGMLCGIAADVTVGPLLRGAEGELPSDRATPEVDPRKLARVEAAIRAHVFGGASTESFLDYWPASGEFRGPLRTGFADALIAAAIPLGLGSPDPAHQVGALPTGDRLGNAYDLMRASMRTWSWYQWLPWLFFYTAPMGLILPIAAAPSEDKLRWRASRLFRPESVGVDDPGEEAWSQLTTLSFALSSIGPAVTTFWLWSDIPDMNGPFALGTVAFVLDVIGAILLGASVGATDRWSPAARWIPAVVLAVMRVIFLILAIREPPGPISTYYWIQTIPLWSTSVTLILGAIADATTGRNDDGRTRDADLNRPLILALYAGVLFIAQCILTGLLTGGSLVSRLLGSGWNRLPDVDRLTGSAPPYARASVLDESTLWSQRPAASPQSLLDLRYPPGSRPLLRMWWTGTGDLQVSHGGHKLRFRIGSGAPQVLALPPVAFTPAELASWLSTRVTGLPSGGTPGGLHVEPASAATTPEATHRLPWPQVVEDLHDEFRSIGVDSAHAYVMNHASRHQLATPFGQRGPAVTHGEGWPIAPGPGLGGAEGTGVGLAAELGTLLALGAASRIHNPAHVPASAPAINPVSQVFRSWNLDERRVNEWRMLIAGGASSEKPPRPPPGAPPPATETIPPDDALLAGAAASPPVAFGTEDLSNQLGWLPLFRAWTRVATDPEQDGAADFPAPYNPRIRRDGRWVQPTNRQLDQAMRYLLDLP